MKKRNRKVHAIVLGSKFGRLEITCDLGMVVQGTKARRMCIATCECDNEIVVRLDQLKSGNTESCGCKFIDFLASGKARMSHGDSRTRFYGIWAGMLQRSRHLNNNTYAKNNINVSKRWRSYESFKADMYQSYIEHVLIHGERDTTIDRINPFGNYSKSNCRWATYKIQANNTIKKWKQNRTCL